MDRWFDNLPFIKGRLPGKIVLSYLMVMYAIILAFVFSSNDRLFCVFAMIFSFVGDYTLIISHKKKSPNLFMLGGTAFIIAHLLYFVAYYIKIKSCNYNYMNRGVFAALDILIALTAIFFIARKTRSVLFYFGLAYLWITGINYITIFSYSYSAFSIESLATIGALSFLASDVIIGLEKFCGLKSDSARKLVWWLYPIGQILLITFA